MSIDLFLKRRNGRAGGSSPTYQLLMAGLLRPRSAT
jgi:hypothetical protein